MAVLPLLAIPVSTLVSAAESGGPPRVDIRATCRAAELDLKKLFGEDTQVTFDGCLSQENTALAQITALAQMVKDWISYPAADTAQCVQPRGHMPSYVEWLTCLEIQKDLRRIRADEKAGGSPPE
jgi:hypothetical protein